MLKIVLIMFARMLIVYIRGRLGQLKTESPARKPHRDEYSYGTSRQPKKLIFHEQHYFNPMKKKCGHLISIIS